MGTLFGELGVDDLEAAVRERGPTNIAKGDAIAVGLEVIPDIVEHGHRVDEAWQRRGGVVEAVQVGAAEVAQVVALASPVSDLAGDGQRLVVVLDGLVVLPEVAVGAAEVAQVGALALPVSDLAGDGQRLVVVLDGLVVLPEVLVGVAEGPGGCPRLAGLRSRGRWPAPGCGARWPCRTARG